MLSCDTTTTSSTYQFQTFCSLLKETEMSNDNDSSMTVYDLLNDPSPDLGLTVFAPIDSTAFTTMMEDEEDNPDASLSDLVLFHVVRDTDNGSGGGPIYYKDLNCSDLIPMGTGEDTRTICVENSPVYQKGAGNTRNSTTTDDADADGLHVGGLPQFLTTDISACNGVLHIIDTVLLPKNYKNTNQKDGTIDDGTGEDSDDKDDDVGINSLSEEEEESATKDILHEYYDNPPYPFTPASSLDFFKEIDPSQFEWVNPDEVQAGQTTCGFLHAPLGSLRDETYPTVDVYICVQFATNPTKGNLFIHCGGPGTLSGCITYLPEMSLGVDNIADYNVISIDQRGLGRSSPTMAQIDCQIGSAYNLFNATAMVEYDQFSEESLRRRAKVLRERVVRCWDVDEFSMNATQDDGSVNTYHFLDYSGTRELAEDMDRFRRLIGADRLSLYGISYGTQVMATYATLFPRNVELFVLDGSASPGSDIYEFSTIIGQGQQRRLDYLIYSCDISDDCPVDDMESCITATNNLLREQVTYNHVETEVMALFLYVLFTEPEEKAEELCSAAASDNVDKITIILTSAKDEQDSAANSQQGNTTDDSTDEEVLLMSDSQPTTWDSDDTNTTYDMLMNSGFGIALAQIFAQDYSGGTTNEDTFVRNVMDFNEKFHGYGSGLPATWFTQWYGGSYYWPRNSPLPPRGNPFITGIVAGQLFDPATPYKMTEEMRASFQSTHLLSSQSIYHGLIADARERSDDNKPCQQHVIDYLHTGYVGFVDGTVCGAPLAASNAIMESFSTFSTSDYDY